MDVVQNSQKFRVRILPGKIHALGGGVRFEVEDFIQLTWHVLTGPTSHGQFRPVWALSTTTTEAINREPQRVATGATAALTATDHTTEYPGGSASKQNHGGRKSNFATSSIGQAPRQPSEATENTEDSSRLR